MADFNKAFLFIEINEGGYSQIPGGTSNEAYFGILRDFHSNWVGWKYIDDWKRDNGTPPYNYLWPNLDVHVKKIYKDYFWDRVQGDHIASQAIATYFFDWFIDSGEAAIIEMQRILEIVSPPGVLTGINEVSIEFLKSMHDSRLQFYKEQASKMPANKRLFKGRLVRANKLYSELKSSQ